jgi:uncharacterized protein (TIGR03435 family)
VRILSLAVMAVFALPGRGQAPPSFEVASIHRNLSGGQNTRIDISDGGRLTVTNGSLKTLIRNAYGILSFQLAGEPGWIDTEMYDIQAKTTAPGPISPDQLKLLLRSLLADRFQLEVHWETREGTVYAMVVDKGGPKFKKSAGPLTDSMNTNKGPGKARMTGTAASMAILASNLGNQLGRFALDKTGLTGAYDFTFEWDPEQATDSAGPSIFTALRDQLGLRLESQKGPVEILVIDRAKRASEN